MHDVFDLCISFLLQISDIHLVIFYKLIKIITSIQNQLPFKS